MPTIEEMRSDDQSPFCIPSQRRCRTRSWKMNRRIKVDILGDHHNILGNFALSKAATTGKNFETTPPCHALMKYMVPSLLALVTLKYQGKPESLFVENPTPVWCFLVATCVYWLTVGARRMWNLSCSKGFRVVDGAAFATGVLSPLSLLSVLLPRRVSFVPLAIWAPLPVVLMVRPMLFSVYAWVHSGITSYVDNIQAKIALGKTSLPV